MSPGVAVAVMLWVVFVAVVVGLLYAHGEREERDWA